MGWPGTLHRCRSNSQEFAWRSVVFWWTEAVEAQVALSRALDLSINFFRNKVKELCICCLLDWNS